MEEKFVPPGRGEFEEKGARVEWMCNKVALAQKSQQTPNQTNKSRLLDGLQRNCRAPREEKRKCLIENGEKG